MISRNSLFLAGACAIVALAGCASGPDIDHGQYWQRINPSESIYQQGPKAQQMLNKDIGRCVVELRELEDLGSIKDAIPTDARGRVLDPDEKKLADWDTPEHDGALFTEHTNYHDFEGCMKAKGWERIKHVPFDVAEHARQNYFLAHVDYGYDPKLEDREAIVDERNFGDLND
jgi:hypothetical protein